MKVDYSDTANLTANRNLEYIKKDNEDVADKITLELEKLLLNLPTIYKMGHKITSKIYSMLFYKKNAFRILYSVDNINQMIYIHAVLHCRQDITPFL